VYIRFIVSSDCVVEHTGRGWLPDTRNWTSL